MQGNQISTLASQGVAHSEGPCLVHHSQARHDAVGLGQKRCHRLRARRHSAQHTGCAGRSVLRYKNTKTARSRSRRRTCSAWSRRQYRPSPPPALPARTAPAGLIVKTEEGWTQRSVWGKTSSAPVSAQTWGALAGGWASAQGVVHPPCAAQLSLQCWHIWRSLMPVQDICTGTRINHNKQKKWLGTRHGARQVPMAAMYMRVCSHLQLK